MTAAELTPWIVFLAAVAVLLVVDIGVLGRRGATMTTRCALAWSAAWISLGLSFSLAAWAWRGSVAAQEYLAGYLVEEPLSIDNLFVFLLVFGSLGIMPQYQRKILFWGDEEARAAKDPTRGASLIVLSVATSIDALAVGLSLGLLGVEIWYPAVLIGVVAFAFTALGLHLGRRFGTLFGKRMEILVGIILVGIGVKILIDHVL